MNWFQMFQVSVQTWAFGNTVIKFRVPVKREIFDHIREYEFLKKDSEPSLFSTKA
jgi:hypothetical protein